MPVGFLTFFLNNCWTRACEQSSQKTSTVICCDLSCFRKKERKPNHARQKTETMKKAIVSRPMRMGNYRKVQWRPGQLQVTSSLTEQSLGLLIQRCLQCQPLCSWNVPSLQPTFYLTLCFPISLDKKKILSRRKMVKRLSWVSLPNTNASFCTFKDHSKIMQKLLLCICTSMFYTFLALLLGRMKPRVLPVKFTRSTKISTVILRV